MSDGNRSSAQSLTNDQTPTRIFSSVRMCFIRRHTPTSSICVACHMNYLEAIRAVHTCIHPVHQYFSLITDTKLLDLLSDPLTTRNFICLYSKWKINSLLKHNYRHCKQKKIMSSYY